MMLLTVSFDQLFIVCTLPDGVEPLHIDDYSSPPELPDVMKPTNEDQNK